MPKRNEPDILDDWIDQVIRNNLIEVHTALPAVIESFDPATQTAKINLSIKRLLRDGQSVPISPVINVPVVFPSGGGFSMTFPVKAGDECLAVFSERAIDNWLQLGGQQDPSDKRIHAYNDAYAILGGKSFANSLSAYSTNSLQIRNNAGTTYINVTNDTITLEINGGGATFNEDGSVMFANGASITPSGEFRNAQNTGLGTHTHPAIGSPPTPGT